MYLYFMVSGTCSLVTVHQPPVLTTALGHDVIMPCHLNLSHDEKMVTPPVLYWLCLTHNNTNNGRLWSHSEKYKGRVDLLDNDPNSSNKSIVFKNVQWADGGKYLCKLSITTQRDKSFRRKGNETLLRVYDTVIFSLTSHNDSLLRCEVNVTRDPGFALSIFHDGCKLQPVDSAPGDAGAAALLFVTLSETISVQSKGEYECRLQLNGDLITKSIFQYHPPAADDGGDAVKNILLTCPTVSEPWLLYLALLLVPITILLALIVALLIYRH